MDRNTSAARAHVLLEFQGKHQSFKRPGGFGGDKIALPIVDPSKQYEKMLHAINLVREDAAKRNERLDPALTRTVPGLLLAFSTIDDAFDAKRFRSEDGRDLGVVVPQTRPMPTETEADAIQKYRRGIAFVPTKKLSWFDKRLRDYGATVSAEKQKNASLIGVLDELRLAEFADLWTDEVSPLPNYGEKVLWELWLRRLGADAFSTLAAKVGIEVEKTRLEIPTRQVRWVRATREQMERVVLNSDAIVQLRSGLDMLVEQPMPSVFDMAVQDSLVERIIAADADAPAVCMLDTGVVSSHPLLAPAARTVTVVRAGWSPEDEHGHGTAMCGLAVYGNLAQHIGNDEQIRLTHGFESVKIVNDSKHADALAKFTTEAVARVEIDDPRRRRVFCIAVTTVLKTQGAPSTWSIAIDNLASEPDAQRLFIVAAGNVNHVGARPAQTFPALNDTTAICDPGQAYNALTVGGYTDLDAIKSQDFKDYTVLANQGDLSPHSSTSIPWDSHFRKPDVVMEAGNLSAPPGGHHDRISDLQLFTTSRDIPTFVRMFDATSAAAAQAAGLAAEILASNRRFWPETARALIVHSAHWTNHMRGLVNSGAITKDIALKRWGYGVPDRRQALQSTNDRLTVVVQDALQPYKYGEKKPKTNEMNLHVFPLPQAALRSLGSLLIEMRITLSYFVEPNPAVGESYASHMLSWKTMTAGESQQAFLQRINKEAREESWKKQRVKQPSWFFGTYRSAGSVTSDWQEATAVDIANLGSVAVVPRVGWWRENPSEGRVERQARYSLIISFRPVETPQLEIDLYTPFVNAIEAATGTAEIVNGE